MVLRFDLAPYEDDPSNMQWQTVADAKARDVERRALLGRPRSLILNAIGVESCQPSLMHTLQRGLFPVPAARCHDLMAFPSWQSS